MSRPPGPRPDSPILGILYDHHCRTIACVNHAVAEGHPEMDILAVLDSYDRAEHPWLHGRRPGDLFERYGDPLYLAGFAIGAVLSVVIFGPFRLAEMFRRVVRRD